MRSGFGIFLDAQVSIHLYTRPLNVAYSHSQFHTGRDTGLFASILEPLVDFDLLSAAFRGMRSGFSRTVENERSWQTVFGSQTDFCGGIDLQLVTTTLKRCRSFFSSLY